MARFFVAFLIVQGLLFGAELTPGSTILVDRKNEDEVDITIIPGEITPEKVTVPPDEPHDSSEDESDDE